MKPSSQTYPHDHLTSSILTVWSHKKYSKLVLRHHFTVRHRSESRLVQVMISGQLPSEISIPNLPNRWRQNMNSVWTDHYQRPLLTVCLYPRGAEGWEKLQQRPLITNLPLCVKFGTKLMGIRIQSTGATEQDGPGGTCNFVVIT